MAVQYQDIQELLRSRADLHVRLNLMPYDGTPEIKERGDGKYLYVRKRVAGKTDIDLCRCIYRRTL